MHHRVAAPINAAFPASTIAVVDPGTQSGINLTAIVEPIPPPQLSLQGDPA